MADNTAMRFKVPEKYLKEYTDKQGALIVSRVRSLSVITTGVFFAGVIISLLTAYNEFNPAEIPVWAVILISSVSVYFFTYHARPGAAVKASAYAFTAVVLICLSYLCVIYSAYINMAPALFLFCLFLISFTIPWNSHDITPISFMHMAAYSASFFILRDFQGQRSPLPDLEIARYADGMTLLAMGAVVAFIIRRKETVREAENFILLKDVESKNEQMRKELELATRIHKSLIPHSVSTDMVDIAVMYLPMYYMGGDYAKFHFVDRDRLIFVICDVTGHGVSAALLVNRLHAEFERLSREFTEPGVLLNEMNDFVTRDFEGINMFLSAFCGLLDFSRSKLLYSNHGHPDQYMYRITRSDVQRMPSQAGILGLPMDDKKVYQHEVDFSKGDKILLFTDGVIETRNAAGECYGDTGLESFIKREHALGVSLFNQKLLDELNTFKGRDFDDDIFILSIHIK